MKKTIFLAAILLSVLVTNFLAQETPPAPAAPKAVSVPAAQEKKLANGLTVAVIEKRAVPLVTIQLLVKYGASAEDANKAGLADITASMLTKGTTTRTATQIAEAVEFLGGTISSGAGWNGSNVAITVTSDKVDQAMAILSDVILHPKFDQKELDLLKTQSLDGLTYNLKQPSALANYVASKYSFGEHPAGGTPASIASITKSDVESFYENGFLADFSIIIFTGEVTAAAAAATAEKYLGGMKKYVRTDAPSTRAEPVGLPFISGDKPSFAQRLLVVDLPKSGQASVGYYKSNPGVGRKDELFYPASVLNSVLGGGYSSRLNLEIRIKRGLSYGAGSSFAWRYNAMNFSTRAQTKNESAAQVAELVLGELKKLADSTVAADELVPRKSVLTGNFGRNLETTAGLANALADLYTFSVPRTELNSYVDNVNGVSDKQIKDFASRAFFGGDIIIVGDYSVFKDDLAKRFPNMKVDVIKAGELDLSNDNLRK
ncbi:MAG: pitrilysin family protein [Acidobacteriota bacterium]